MNYVSTTTLNEIRAQQPCKGGWENLLSTLGKTKADDEPLSLLTILNSNGLDDALWCLRVTSLERLSRHFQAWCAEQVLHIFEADRQNDSRIRDQIAMMWNDDATLEDRDAAWGAARDAAWDAIAALVTWDSSADLLECTPDVLRAMIDLAEPPVCHQAALLLPYAIVRFGT